MLGIYKKVPFHLFYLSIDLFTYLSIDLFIHLSILLYKYLLQTTIRASGIGLSPTLGTLL